jgi:hypothetical protein
VVYIKGIFFFSSFLVVIIIIMVGLYVAPTQYRSYGDFPASLVQEDLRSPSDYINYFVTKLNALGMGIEIDNSK